MSTNSTFVLKEFNETLTRFKSDENKWENHTKAEYIRKLDDLVTVQIKDKVINIEVNGISSYLYKKINEFGITVSDTYIRDVIPEIHTRNYIKSQVSLDLNEPVKVIIETSDPTLLLETDQFNKFYINGTEQKPVEHKQREDKLEPIFREEKKTRQYVYLTALSKLANKFHLTIETLKDRYNESDEIERIIDGEIGNVEDKLEAYARTWAKIESNKGMIDLRRDYGEYEKIMAAFMIETGETIARISQLMDYSEKYGSIGILRENRVREFFENETNYPLWLRSCPVCLVDISQKMNENIALYRESKDLGIDIPNIKY